MKRSLIILAAAAMLASASGAQAAPSCLKGALVGGVAGHVLHHHGILGAITGCVIGHEMARHDQKKKLQQKRLQQNQPQPVQQ